MSRPFVRVVGVALSLGGCQKPPLVYNNPPEPTTDPQPTTIPEAQTVPPPTNPPLPVAPTINPPAPLPTWDAVKSSHPVGATNPPSPVLVVSRSPQACFKDWMGGMVAPPPDVMATGGRVVDTMQQATGTQIECPEGQPAKLIAAYDAWVAGGSRKGGL